MKIDPSKFYFFFKVFIKASERISIDTAAKSVLKLGNLPSLKVIRQNRVKTDVASLLHKVATFYRRLYGGGQNVFNNWRLFGATSSLVFNKSCLKLAPTNFKAFFLAELTDPGQKLKKKKNTCKVFTELHCTVSVMVSFLLSLQLFCLFGFFFSWLCIDEFHLSLFTPTRK